MNDYNPAGLHAAATSLEQMATALTAALPTSAAVPPAADPVSVTAAANLNARSAAVRNTITAAINEATATAHHLRLAANRFDDTDTANEASLGLGGSGTAVPAASTRPATPPPPLPTIPVPAAPTNAFVPPDPEVDPEPVALALHAGPGAAALTPHATEWKSTATALDDSATTTTSAASSVRSAWDAPEGHAAAANITKLGTWLTSAAGHAGGISSASTAHAASFTTAHAAHPDPVTISTAKQRVVELSTAATADPTAIPALTAAHTHLIDLARQGASTTVSYHADTTRNAPPSTPPADPPKVTSNGSAADDKKNSKASKPKKPGDTAEDATGDAGDQISATTTAATPGGGTDPSIAADGTRLAEQQIAQQQDQKLLQTGIQIGTQIAQQAMQGLQQGVSTAAQVTSKLGGSGLPAAPGSSFASPDIGLSDSSFGGGGGGLGGGGGGGGLGGGAMGAASGDTLGTEPSGFEGALAPSTPSTALPPAVEGTTPTTSSPPGKSGASMPMGSMMHPPMMGGMGAGAGGGGERQRNHDIYPDRKVFDDDTEYTDDTIGKLPDIAPSITPAFNDGTGTR